MPSKIVDLSARSAIIREEPFYLYFWECTPEEYLDFLRDPRKMLTEMGINLPQECRIETVMQNHDWMSANTSALSSTTDGPVIVCNVGTGGVGIDVFRIISFAHLHEAIGQYKKTLLHAEDKQER
jgi:hypothetical protein